MSFIFQGGKKMPKVSDEYMEEKRNFILDCTEEILKEKPLYLVTMRDIIKKAGFSQGVIYRYYSGLDEIYGDFINRHTTDTFLEQKMEALLHSTQTEKVILSECFIVLGEYIEELMKSVAGKTFFDLMVLYASDFEKKEKIFPKLQFRQTLEYAQNKIVEYAISNVEKGVFRPHIPVETLIQFVSTFIDGIALHAVVMNESDTSAADESATEISELFRVLAQAVINFLEV
jgi:AcrR family transcriptional regulator